MYSSREWYRMLTELEPITLDGIQVSIIARLLTTLIHAKLEGHFPFSLSNSALILFFLDRCPVPTESSSPLTTAEPSLPAPESYLRSQSGCIAFSIPTSPSHSVSLSSVVLIPDSVVSAGLLISRCGFKVLLGRRGSRGGCTRCAHIGATVAWRGRR